MRTFKHMMGLLAVVGLVMALAPAAHAQTALIDFGRAGGPEGLGSNTTTGTPDSYNNVFMDNNHDNATTGNVALNDTSDSATGWSINVTEGGDDFGGNAGAGADESTFPAAISGFETTAIEDSMFGNGEDPLLTVTISGLDDSLTYDLLFYGSRQAGQNIAAQTWSLTQGSGGANVVHQSNGNATTVVDWDGLVTNGSGVIAFTISGSQGTSGALALNFGSITANAAATPGTLIYGK